MNLEGLEHAERRFDVLLVSMQLGLTGQVDELIWHEGTIIPVDYKLSRREQPHFKLQLTAYAMMAEEQYQVPITFGLLYLIQARKTVRVAFSSQLRQKVVRAVTQMRQIANAEYMPPPPDSIRPCLECEFRRFCNDVV
jgi:CRISPR-associated exonuclease Cas4